MMPPCGGPTRKHHFLVHRWNSRNALLRCKWTMCQKAVLVSNDYIRSITLKGN